LDTSLQQSISQTELIRLDYTHSSFQTKYAVQFFQEQDVSHIAYDDTFIAARSDNRDFKVFINCNAENEPTAEQLCKPTTSTNTSWVQVISYILTILSVVCETKDSGRDLAALAGGLNQVLEREQIKNDITVPEFWLARYVSNLTNALVLIKDSKDATKELKNATTILQDERK
jgi:N-terminal acetyltransferase B complex non-catalytic subunit